MAGIGEILRGGWDATASTRRFLRDELMEGPSATGRAILGEENPLGVGIGWGRSAIGAAGILGAGVTGGASLLAVPAAVWGYAGAKGAAKWGFSKVNTPEGINNILKTGEKVGRRMMPGQKLAAKAGNAYLEGTRKMWESPMGKRKVIGAHIGIGMLFGAASASFKLNRAVDVENARRVDESGSAYEGGPGAFGGGGGRMPHASGKMVMGMHRGRNG